MWICVAVFGVEEGDCWNLDYKQTDILSSHNKKSAVSMNDYCQRQLGQGLLEPSTISSQPLLPLLFV